MGIRKALLPLIPSPILQIYRKIKRHFVSKWRIFGKTGNNYVEIRKIQLNKDVLKEKKIDSIKISWYLAWENPFDTNDYGKYQYQENRYKIDKEDAISVMFTNYGLWTLEIKYRRGDRVVVQEVRMVKVEAPEYNIAYLSATLPAEIFLIKLWDITSEKCPTIVGLERVLFDYKALPENVFPFPLATEEELNTAYKGFYSYSQRMVFYISMLYKMNPDSKFNLYLCDHQAFYTLAFLYSNRIPEKNFNVYLLSDGTGSYEGFNYVFGNPGGEKTYNAMKDTWALSKNMAVKSGIQKWKKENFITCGSPYVSLTQKSESHMIELSNRLAYAYVITRENQNFTWILHNPALLDVGDKIHFPLTDSMQKIDFIAGIKSLEEHREELIRLLGLDYSVFKRSHSMGKKICMLFGSYPPAEADIKYVNATVEKFGKEYDYYFKEHPRTVVNPEREKTIKERDIEFLDTKIPTEIYMMIDSDICLAGYLSSAFLSIGLLRNSTEQILSIWDRTDRKVKTSCLDFTAKTAMSIKDNSVNIYD